LLRIKVELDFREDFKADRPLLVLPPRYKVELYEVAKDLRGSGPRGVIDHGVGEGAYLPRPASETLKTYINVPISKELIDKFNEMKRIGKLPAFNIYLEVDAIYFETGFPKLYGFTYNVWKSIHGQERPLVVFSTDEVDLLMRDLKYVDVLRIEIPLPLKIEEVAQEKLVRSVKELMVAEELLKKGDYPEVLRTCRNIVMNHLTKVVEIEEEGKKRRKRVFSDEITDYILGRVPEYEKSLYEDVIKSIDQTLEGLLQHLHKFIKEDTGKLLRNPLRADAEYAFYTLFSIVKYLTELSLER